jgi:hypothetical protein
MSVSRTNAARFPAEGTLESTVWLLVFGLRFGIIQVVERDPKKERKEFIKSWYRVVTSASPGMATGQSL